METEAGPDPGIVPHDQDLTSNHDCSSTFTILPSIEQDLPLTSSPSEPLSMQPLEPEPHTTSVPDVHADGSGRPKPASPARIDPHRLLNPKATSHTDQVDKHMEVQSRLTPQVPSFEFVFDSTSSKRPQEDPEPADIAAGQSSLIEQAHNVEERSDRPVKRVKVGHGEDASQRPAAKGNAISKHFEDIRKQRENLTLEFPPALAAKEPHSAAGVVDLTEGQLLYSPSLSH